MLAALLVSVLLMIAALVCMVCGLVWSRRRGRTAWNERALARGAPSGAERRRVRPYLRHGAPAPDPETAHLTVRVATDLRRRLDNSWYFTGMVLFLVGNALTLITRSAGQYDSPVFMWFGIAVFVLALSSPLYRQAALDRANLALAINRELAELYEAPNEEPPPPRER